MVRRNSRVLCGRGEGAKKLSSVPGGHILGGMGEPAQLFRPISWIDLSDITLIRTSSYKGIVGGSAAVFQTIRRGTRALDAAQPMQRCRARSHFSGINSASAAVDSMKLGGHWSAASLRRRCASFLFFVRSANSPL